MSELEKFRLYLGRFIEMIIERPIGFYHDGSVYLVNYGYIPDTIAADGEEMDVYLLGVHDPLPIGSKFECKVIAIVDRKDGEKKLVACPPDNASYTKEQIEALLEFREKRYAHKILEDQNNVCDL